MGDLKLIDIAVALKHETPKAYLVETGEGDTVERTNWIEVGKYYPSAGDRIMLFFPGKEIPVVLTTYDDWDNWVPRPTHWARTLTGPAVPR